jgi:hypothetical protein
MEVFNNIVYGHIRCEITIDEHPDY